MSLKWSHMCDERLPANGHELKWQKKKIRNKRVKRSIYKCGCLFGKKAKIKYKEIIKIKKNAQKCNRMCVCVCACVFICVCAFLYHLGVWCFTVLSPCSSSDSIWYKLLNIHNLKRDVFWWRNITAISLFKFECFWTY